jgi:hypothetical protein
MGRNLRRRKENRGATRMTLYKISCTASNYWLLTDDWRTAAACVLLLDSAACAVVEVESGRKVFENKRMQSALTQFLRKTGWAYSDYIEEFCADISAAFGTLCQNPVTRTPIPLGEKLRDTYFVPGKEAIHMGDKKKKGKPGCKK